MTELKIRIMERCIEEFEKAFSGSIVGDAEGSRYSTSELGGVDESGRHAAKDQFCSSGTR
jgi:hypothetical protein